MGRRAFRLAGAALMALLPAAGPAADRQAWDNRAIVTDFARVFYVERDVRGAFETDVAPD